MEKMRWLMAMRGKLPFSYKYYEEKAGEIAVKSPPPPSPSPPRTLCGVGKE